jgi:hypothetical protein
MHAGSTKRAISAFADVAERSPAHTHSQHAGVGSITSSSAWFAAHCHPDTRSTPCTRAPCPGATRSQHRHTSGYLITISYLVIVPHYMTSPWRHALCIVLTRSAAACSPAPLARLRLPLRPLPCQPFQRPRPRHRRLRARGCCGCGPLAGAESPGGRASGGVPRFRGWGAHPQAAALPTPQLPPRHRSLGRALVLVVSLGLRAPPLLKARESDGSWPATRGRWALY